MSETITAQTVKKWLQDGEEIAFLDVREHGQYGEGHPFFVASVPYSRLELDIARLVPRLSTRIVLLDDDDGVAEHAHTRLVALGYTDIHVLEHGVRGWQRAGLQLFKGVHLPSKTFGELAEHAYDTPRIQAPELEAMLQHGEPVVVLDGRPIEEFHKMNIPGAICCPNIELPYRIHALVSDETTPIVINCAGRTRSIIGAQTLINAGIRNPVYALENGTQGWFLNDLQLGHGNTQRYPDVRSDAPEFVERREVAQTQARQHGVEVIDAEQLAGFWRDSERNTFLLDVRTPEEYAVGTVTNAVHAPGGQLLQGTDLYVGVRGARIVLVDTDGIRAPLTASWLRQMGHEAYVLSGDVEAKAVASVSRENPVAHLPETTAQDVAQRLSLGPVRIVDVRASSKYRSAHIDGSVWSIRPRIAVQLGSDLRPLVLVADDAAVAALAASELEGVDAVFLKGDVQAWKTAGLPVVDSPDTPPDAACIDYLFFVHDRHDGNKEAARRYLAWETGLIAQLDESELASFRVHH